MPAKPVYRKVKEYTSDYIALMERIKKGYMADREFRELGVEAPVTHKEVVSAREKVQDFAVQKLHPEKIPKLQQAKDWYAFARKTYSLGSSRSIYKPIKGVFYNKVYPDLLYHYISYDAGPAVWVPNYFTIHKQMTADLWKRWPDLNSLIVIVQTEPASVGESIAEKAPFVGGTWATSRDFGRLFYPYLYPVGPNIGFPETTESFPDARWRRPPKFNPENFFDIGDKSIWYAPSWEKKEPISGATQYLIPIQAKDKSRPQRPWFRLYKNEFSTWQLPRIVYNHDSATRYIQYRKESSYAEVNSVTKPHGVPVG